MASRTRQTTTKVYHVRNGSPRKIPLAEKLAFIAKHERVSDPTNTAAVTRKYNELKSVPWHLEKKATKRQREELAARGHRVTKRGVIVDGPRNIHREKIPGARMTLEKGGVVKWSVKQRRDYVYGFTKKEKREFAKNPESIIARFREKLKRDHPSLARKRKIQTRLQWGAYQATKDFAPSEFDRKRGSLWRFREAMKKGDKDESDKLVGIHFTVYVTAKKQKEKKHGKRKG